MKAPGAFRCLLMLALCDVALRILGFARTLRVATFFSSTETNAASDEVMNRTLHNILVATAFYPGRSKCLEQSVTSFVFLRRRGFPVHIRLGVQPYPFYAHAWLELNGRPLTESPEVVARFALMPDLAL
jgi:hypothetical protein